MKKTLIALTIMLVFFSCKRSQETGDKIVTTPTQEDKTTSSTESKERKTVTYVLENTEQWLLIHKTDSLAQAIAFAINRTDQSNFSSMDTAIVPIDLSFELVDYLPFPVTVDFIKDINKIIFFSYPTQTFAAYEKGKLIYTGQTNMGREDYLTPIGLFFTNWKAKVAISTINKSWILNWNFNISNKEGIGWHQYSLPGYPVSHSCLRLQEKDAQYLYNWADQWILADKFNILVKGTPVIVFGKYDFKSPKPWLQLIYNPHSMDIAPEELEKITQPYLDEILAAQKDRDTFMSQAINTSTLRPKNEPQLKVNSPKTVGSAILLGD